MVSYAEKLDKLEKKIEKRKSAIAELTEKLKEELAEYDRISVMALAEKFNLKGKDLFDAIEREHDELEKLKESNSADESAADTDDAETLGQTSFFGKKNNPYSD